MVLVFSMMVRSVAGGQVALMVAVSLRGRGRLRTWLRVVTRMKETPLAIVSNALG